MTTDSQRWDDHTKKVIAATVGKGLSAADMAHFEAVCISTGLDPLRREIYAVSRGGKMAIQTGIDGYLALANRTRELDGMEVLFFDDKGAQSEVWLSPKPPTACLVRVYRKGCSHPFVASARYDAYKQNGQMWTKFGETMLAKCATTLALRRAFADVISGIASADEMDQAGLAVPEALTQGTPLATQPAKTSLKPEPAIIEEAAANLAAATAGKTVEAPSASTELKEEATAPAEAVKVSELPDREDLKGAVAALYKQAKLSGVTTTGWQTLEKQCGGSITTTMAAKALPALKDQEKVALLNSGKSTTGVAV